mmetsp:Transcript_82162/g.227909  ORF Transcript_82162/g.227909 Transcript_82162/m.227909 type:complete len:273 (+) Transcript_82162:1247-2065(+)
MAHWLLLFQPVDRDVRLLCYQVDDGLLREETEHQCHCLLLRFADLVRPVDVRHRCLMFHTDPFPMLCAGLSQLSLLHVPDVHLYLPIACLHRTLFVAILLSLVQLVADFFAVLLPAIPRVPLPDASVLLVAAFLHKEFIPEEPGQAEDGYEEDEADDNQPNILAQVFLFFQVFLFVHKGSAALEELGVSSRALQTSEGVDPRPRDHVSPQLRERHEAVGQRPHAPADQVQAKECQHKDQCADHATHPRLDGIVIDPQPKLLSNEELLEDKAE